MEISLQLHPANSWPLRGIFVENSSVSHWLYEMQRMGLSLENTSVYPIAGTTANTVWGCLLISDRSVENELLDRNMRCQQVGANLFIPEKTKVFPDLTPEELQHFFGQNTWFFHPVTGLSECEEALSAQHLFSITNTQSSYFQRPQEGVYRPSTIKSFQIHPVPPEQLLEELQQAETVASKKLKDDPLNFGEKVRLGFYKLMSLGKKPKVSINPGTGEGNSGTTVQTGQVSEGFWSKLGRKLGLEKLANRVAQDMSELERRNQKAIDRLIELFDKDPLEALRYALPLNDNGTGRGGQLGQIDLTRRWDGFSFSGRSSSGGSAVISGDHYARLREKYMKQANTFIEQGDYRSAAFVHLKLLNSPLNAAETFEKGKLYQEAAALFLDKRLNNRSRAAECYEKGNMYAQAIPLYKELENHEKVGDLYAILGNKEQAKEHYLQKAESLIRIKKHFNAAKLYEEKLSDSITAREILLQAWNDKSDSVICLKKYLEMESDSKERIMETERIATTVSSEQAENFVFVLKHFYQQNDDQKDNYKEVAFEIVSKNIGSKPTLIEQLNVFNTENKHFSKDTSRFLNWRRNKKPTK